MRGKPVLRSRVYTATGITPADAGKTLRGSFGNTDGEDHPRGCGENSRWFIIGLPKTGITPADAGKTCSFYGQRRGTKDHPRGCGENIVRLNCGE